VRKKNEENSKPAARLTCTIQLQHHISGFPLSNNPIQLQHHISGFPLSNNQGIMGKKKQKSAPAPEPQPPREAAAPYELEDDSSSSASEDSSSSEEDSSATDQEPSENSGVDVESPEVLQEEAAPADVGAIDGLIDGYEKAEPLGKRQESVLDRSADPFAKREGKTLLWRNVNMTLAAKGKDPERQLLNDVWGEVPGHETTAIMGKTILLSIAIVIYLLTRHFLFQVHPERERRRC
jgi:hypothetical protein